MNGEGARQDAPVTELSLSDDISGIGELRIPRVTLIVELEADPRIVVDCATEADSDALRAWVRDCRPDIDGILRSIADELKTKRAA